MPIPFWVGRYIGLPFREHGRDIKGIDCWGLVRLVYLEQFSTCLPSLTQSYARTTSVDSISRLITQQASTWKKIEYSAEELGDVIVLRVRGQPMHLAWSWVMKRCCMLKWARIAPLKNTHRADGKNEFVVFTATKIHTMTQKFKEALPDSESVDVHIAPHPFAVERIQKLYAEGKSIADILQDAFSPSGYYAPAVRVYLDGHEIAADKWTRVKPKKKTTLTVRVVPLGGGGGVKTRCVLFYRWRLWRRVQFSLRLSLVHLAVEIF